MRAWLSNRLKTNFRAADESSREATFAPTEFRGLLRRECARSNRNGHQFALVDMTVTAMGPKIINQFVDLVWERMRATDAAGWISEPERLCALLFECPEPAAQRFGEHVVKRMAALGVEVAFTVHTYPGPLPGHLADLADVSGHASRSTSQAGGDDGRLT
jgi:hypothetical protein